MVLSYQVDDSEIQFDISSIVNFQGHVATFLALLWLFSCENMILCSMFASLIYRVKYGPLATLFMWGDSEVPENTFHSRVFMNIY